MRLQIKFNVEWLGYLASFFIMLSFLMKDVTRLRFINALGCICFMVYGYMVNAWPVILTNFFVFCVNAYHVFQSRNSLR